MKKIIVISILVMIALLLISCGGGAPKPQPAPVPDIIVNAVLDALVTIVTENATPSEHRDESNPIILGNVDNFKLNIEKKTGIFYTVVFRSAAQQYEEQNNRCCFEIDISTVASGKYPVRITASNNAPGLSSRDSKTVEIWIQVINNPPAKAFNPSPANNSVNVKAKNLELSWNSSDPENDSLTYKIYLGTSANNMQLIQTQSEKTHTLSQLGYGTDYFWRVDCDDNRASSKRDLSQGDIWTFKTENEEYGAPTITLLSPADGATEQATQLTLSWQGTVGGQTNASPRDASITGYKVYVAKNGEVYGAGEEENGTTKDVELDYASEYKWKVEVFQNDGKSTMSDEATFSTVERKYAAPTITLLSPADGATEQATQLTLSWQGTAGGQTNASPRDVSITGYKVYVAKNGEVYGAGEEENGTTKDVELDYASEYKWKVEVFQNDGKSTMSDEATFSTVERKYAAPTITLLSPADGATEQATQLTLSWQGTVGGQTNASPRDASITGYKVYVAKNGEVYGAGEEENGTTKDVELDYASEYKWKVEVFQSDGKSTMSDTWTFSTVDRIYNVPSIALLSPADGATEQATQLTLSWQGTVGGQTNASPRDASITGYKVYVAKNGEVYGAGEEENGTTKDVELDYASEYKWKVEVFQNDGKSTMSDEATFSTVERKYAAPTITLLSPADGATEQATQLTLSWQGTAGGQTNASPRDVSITGYKVYVAKNGEVYGAGEEENGTTKDVELDYASEYKWKVEVFQNDGKSTMSDEATFSTVERKYAAPTITLLSPADGATEQATQLTLSWQGTVGGQTNASPRDASITGYKVYVAKNGEVYGAGEEENGTTKDVELDYASEYKWKVEVFQNDEKSTMSDEATFSTAKEIFRLKQLGPEGDLNVETNAYNIIDNRGFTGMWSISFMRTRIPEIFKNANSWKITIDGNIYIFTLNMFKDEMYETNVPDSVTNNIEVIRNGVFEIN